MTMSQKLTAEQIDMRPSRGRFGWATSGAVAGPDAVFDLPVYVDEGWVVIPTKGGLVPGWALVLPRTSALNIANLPESVRATTGAVRRCVWAGLRKSFRGTVFEFEHGASSKGGLTACGVDHAHLHQVVLPFDLIKAVGDECPGRVERTNCSGASIDLWAGIDARKDYWVVRNTDTGESIVTYPSRPVSQGIRRIIARGVGRQDCWDYNVYPYRENALATRRALVGHLEGCVG